MKSWLKQNLPHWLKELILKAIKLPGMLLLSVFKRSRFLASINYAFFNRQFAREHKSVLAGKAAYQQSLKDIGVTSVLLRRNIHRLEKGLIMQPRRDVFAEDYISETVKIYQRALSLKSLDSDERKWVADVLAEYFNVVKDTKTIEKARRTFNAISNTKQDDENIFLIVLMPCHQPIFNMTNLRNYS